MALFPLVVLLLLLAAASSSMAQQQYPYACDSQVYCT